MPAEPRWTGVHNGLLVVLQFGLMLLVRLGPRSPAGAAGWPAPWSSIAAVLGLALVACGALLALAGALKMGLNATPSPRPRDGAPLLVDGAYGLVRHPMYGGLILAAFGLALTVNGSLTVLYACLLFAGLDYKTRHEERLLQDAHEGYAEYRGRVRKLIPFLY